jgi:very-short-patch-repair endonuclease
VAVDGRIAALAERQHGVVSRTQLMEIGLGRRAIGYRLACGRLHCVHRGVYAVGHRSLSREGRWMAAVLVAGAGAALSHRPAGAHWGLRPTARAQIEVTSPRQSRSRPRVKVYRSFLPDDEVTRVDGIPVTTVSRTLLDLASVLQPHQLERAMEAAEVRRLSDRLSLDDLLERYPRRRGSGAIRSILVAGRLGATVTRSELEERFLAFVKDAGLPRLEVNGSVEAGGRTFECDCVWRADRLIVELDGHPTHAPAGAFERDRARDRALHAAGWRVVRLTWRQLHDEARAVAADLRALLRS